jgi:hypothetical protein
LSLSNILVDPATLRITGVVDWECTGTRPFWETRYPMLLQGHEIEEEPESLGPGDEDVARVEYWEDWEKAILRRQWNEEVGNMDRRDDATDKMRLAWRRDLDWLEISAGMAIRWARAEFEKWVGSKP